MKNLKKIIALLLCAVLLVAGSVVGTLAYLTAQDTVLNTFTVGDVKINVDEAEVNEDGVPVDPAARTETGNKYHLLPGHTYTKDPTLTVLADSEDSYVRILVKVKNLASLKSAIPVAAHPEYYAGDVFLLQKLVDGWDSTVWVFEDCTESGTDGVYEFRYYDVVAKSGTDTKLDPLFDTITVPGFIDNAYIKHLGGVEISVVGEAIQADGFANAGAAWTAFGEQNP